ncbi:MAG: peptidylprolyl isomerase [Acidobacteria bacterium]|nr:peptidylprolyl isomerase [Acidobacteriota bacterium]
MRPAQGYFALWKVATLAALLVPAALALSADAKPPLSIYFETQLPYFYEGDNLPVAMTVKNVTESTVDNSNGLDLLAGLQVEDARGAKLKKSETAGILLTQPKEVEKSAFFGRVLSLNELFPGLQKAGNYRLSWKGEGAEGNSLVLHVVERYDPKKDYRAKFETEFGNFVIALNKEASPRHVRNFVDLVREGYYNGNQFHRVIPGQAIIGGSPTGDPAAGAGYNLDPELSEVPTDAGTMIQVRNRETGAMDSGAHIMILGISKEDMTGRVTVLGKVVEGMDTVKTLCQVPVVQTRGEAPGAPARPVKPLLIKRVTVTEVAPSPGAAKPAGKN